MHLLTHLLARILIAIPFGVFGFFHLTNSEGMATMLPESLPYGQVWVIITGITLILCSISIIIMKYNKIAGFVAAGFMLLTILFVHVPLLSDPARMAMTAILKDLSIMGGSLLVAGLTKRESF